MSAKYWVIGTKTSAYFDLFIKIVKDFNLVLGDKLIELREPNVKKMVEIRNLHGDIVHTFTAESTARQYLSVWKALGFVKKNEGGSQYTICTDFRRKELLFEYSKIFIFLDSNDEDINSYRFSIIVNVLINSKKINELNENFKKIKLRSGGVISGEKVKKMIGIFEKYLSKSKDFIDKAKEKYDTEF